MPAHTSPIAAGQVDPNERVLGVEALAATRVVASDTLGERHDRVVIVEMFSEQRTHPGLGLVAGGGGQTLRGNRTRSRVPPAAGV